MFLASYTDHSQHSQPGRVQQIAGKTAKLVACILLYLLVIIYKFVAYVLSWGGYCSGTGTGTTRFYRLCNYSSFFILLLPDLLLLTMLMFWRPLGRLHLAIRIFLIIVYIIYVIFSHVLWDLPFFLTSVYVD